MTENIEEHRNILKNDGDDPENWEDTESEEDIPKQQEPPKPQNESPGAVKLRSWLNQILKIVMTDKRVLTGIFQCTDRDANVILSCCCEYLDGEMSEEPRMLGLIMVPGKHIVSISIKQLNPIPSSNELDVSTSTSEPVVV